MKSPKPEKRTVTILTYPGYREGAAAVPVEVEADVYGDLIALHKALHFKNVPGWDRYSVTHLPTSLALGHFSLQRVAKQYALACLGLLEAAQAARSPGAQDADEVGMRALLGGAYRQHKFLDGTTTTGG